MLLPFFTLRAQLSFNISAHPRAEPLLPRLDETGDSNEQARSHTTYIGHTTRNPPVVPPSLNAPSRSTVAARHERIPELLIW